MIKKKTDKQVVSDLIDKLRDRILERLPTEGPGVSGPDIHTIVSECCAEIISECRDALPAESPRAREAWRLSPN